MVIRVHDSKALLRRLSIGFGSALLSVAARSQSSCTTAPSAVVFPQGASTLGGVGVSVAVNATADRVFIGDPGYGLPGSVYGAVWVVSNAGTPSQSEVVVQPTTSFTNMQFGRVGATNADGTAFVAGTHSGGATAAQPKAFVFRFNGVDWIEDWRGGMGAGGKR